MLFVLFFSHPASSLTFTFQFDKILVILKVKPRASAAFQRKLRHDMTRIGFIGFGLIGGSIARAIRKYHGDYSLAAYSHHPEPAEEAVREGVLDAAYSENDERFSDCDIIFLCAPVETNISYFPFLRKTIKKSCIVTDVGSVKGIVMKAAEECGLAANFIGGHPMTGSEKTGYSASADYLLENAYYFVTRNPQNRQEDVERLVDLITSIRALPMVVDAEEHDYIVAGVSHLPHIVASALVNIVKDIDTEDHKMKQVAAGGFRDITRIASSSPVMWQQICATNRDQILYVLDRYIDCLERARGLIAAGDADALYEMFRSSRDYRNSLNDSLPGSVPRQYALWMELYDEAGGIATVTILLAMSQINIKNIGIVHNREFEEGVLRIEFYTEDAREKAIRILRERNYKIRKKS